MRPKFFKNRLFISDNRNWYKKPKLIAFLVLITPVLLIAPFTRELFPGLHPLIHFTGSIFHIAVFVLLILQWAQTNRFAVNSRHIFVSDHNTRLWLEQQTLTQFWYSEQKLFIQRVNRVDELDYSTVRKADFDKLLAKLDELQVNQATAPPEVV